MENSCSDLEKFKLAVDNASDQIIITDYQDKIIYANPATVEATGYSLQEMTGKTPALWGDQMNLELFELIKNRKGIKFGEFSNVRKNGEHYPAEVSISPIINQSGKIEFLVRIERDITKAKEVDKAKTEFVSMASHQIRTPLTAVSWYAEMLLKNKAGKLLPKQRQYLQEIAQATKRMNWLASALLNVSRIELDTFSIEPRKIDLSEISKSVISELKIQADKKNLKIVEKYDKKFTIVNADPNLSRVIFQNLLSNAIKYSKNKGEICLSISGTNDQKVDEDILIMVKDNGYGIPENQQNKIFTKLFRADNAKKNVAEGTGLGLYIVKSIAEHSGCKIWFKSQENKGSTFFVSIPKNGMVKKTGERNLSN